MIEIIHKECEGVAIMCEDKDYYANDMAMANDFKHVNGEDAQPQEKFICDSCKQNVMYHVNDKNRIYARTRF